MSQGVKVQNIRRYPGLAAALLTGFSCLLWPLAARAATCVVVDEQRDGLTAAQRGSVRTLFEDALTEEKQTVARAGA